MSAWLVPSISILLSLLTCGSAWGKIGETQDKMIQRLGEPKSKSETFAIFKLSDLLLTARFNDGVCIEEALNLDRLKEKCKERVKRIEALLRDSSGGRIWEIANLSGDGVEWETTDGALKAELRIDRYDTEDGSEENEELTITDTVAEKKRIENRVKIGRIATKKWKTIFLVLFVPFCVVTFLVIRRWESIITKYQSALWWLAAFYVPLLLYPLGEYIFPSLSGLLILVTIVWFFFASFVANDLGKR